MHNPEYKKKYMLAFKREEVIKKISEANKDREKSKTEKERISKSVKKVWLNPNYHKRMSDNHKGQQAWNKGMKMSEKHRKNLSKAHKGYRIPLKTKIKLSLALKNYFISNKTSKDRLSGENSLFWQGGISREPYPFEFDARLKESIKKRDGYRCRNPYCNDKKARLCIHHINYDKTDCCPENLITLCNYCNVKANFNREFWQSYFKEVSCQSNL